MEIYNTTDMLLFLAMLLMMLVINAFFIVGLNKVTFGSDEMLPNGKVETKGKILYFVRRYFETHRIKIIYADMQRSQEFIDRLKKLMPMLDIKVEGTSCFFLNTQNLAYISIKNGIESSTGYLTRTEDMSEGLTRVIFYKEIKEYDCPGWIRSMLYDCPPCMSTIYGNLFYWFFIGTILGYTFCFETFIVSLFYWVALSYMNVFIEKR